jgi:hypothetical protein
MSRASKAAKWTGKLLLQVPIYLVTSYLVRQLLGGCYGLLIKAGSVLPPNLLFQHFLIVSLLDGFLAGLLGLLVLRATFLLPFRMQGGNESALKKPQAWTWILFTGWLMLGILKWIAKNTHQSVLAASSGVTFSGVIQAFFGSGCQLLGTDIHQMIFSDCMNQLNFTHLWLGTIGYSAAALTPSGWVRLLRKQPQPVVVEDSNHENHQEQLAQ